MESIVIHQPDRLAIEKREIPVPAKGEVRVRIKLAGICGSDSHIYRGHNPFAKYPRVIGHEFFGVIDSVDVERIALMGFSSDPCQITQQGITGKELSLFSSRLNAHKFPTVIAWMAQGLIDLGKLIPHQFDYRLVTDSLDIFEKDQRKCCKVLLTFTA